MAQQIQNTFWAGVIFMVVVSVFFYLSHRDEDHGPTRWARWKAWAIARYMSTPGPVPVLQENNTEQHSDAAEQPTEHPGTEGAEYVPGLVEQLAALDDDALLEALALVQTEDGEYRFAESRVGRFVGGRLEDRIEQVRAVRGVETPPPPGRTLRVRDTEGERVIPY